MLQRLFVQNLLFIDKIDIDFVRGLSVITGETGSGKSVLLECIKFALGDKLPNNFSSKNGQISTIFLEFNIANNRRILNILSDNSIVVENNTLSIRRTFNAEKKSKIFVNDIPVNLSLIKEISTNLIEYQGQHSQTILLDPKQQQQILDLYGELEEHSELVGDIFRKFKSESNELVKLEEENLLQDSDKEYFGFVLKELEELSPEEGEIEELAEKRKMLLDSQKIIQAVKNTIDIIEENKIETSLINAYKTLIKADIAQNASFSVTSELSTLDKVTLDISEIVDSLSSKIKYLEQDADLKKIEDRYFLMKEMARKYRCQPDELVKYLTEVHAKLHRIDNLAKITELKRQEVDKLKKQYFIEAKKLSDSRKIAALNLEKNLEKELITLKMDKTIFKVSIDADDSQISHNGIDKIEFLVTTNPDIPLGPLREVSSGGELSRFMLATRVVLLQLKSPPTIIFDEIDTGIGGAVADAVGDKLAILSQNYQLLVITHHPQVAAKADSHYLIQKKFIANETSMNIDILSEEGRKEELARMLSGKNITLEARNAASQLQNNTKI